MASEETTMRSITVGHQPPIENMTLGRNSVGYLTESLLGAGSPQAQRIQIGRQMDVEGEKGLVKGLAGIDGGMRNEYEHQENCL